MASANDLEAKALTNYVEALVSAKLPFITLTEQIFFFVFVCLFVRAENGLSPVFVSPHPTTSLQTVTPSALRLLTVSFSAAWWKRCLFYAGGNRGLLVTLPHSRQRHWAVPCGNWPKLSTTQTRGTRQRSLIQAGGVSLEQPLQRSYFSIRSTLFPFPFRQLWSHKVPYSLRPTRQEGTSPSSPPLASPVPMRYKQRAFWERQGSQLGLPSVTVGGGEGEGGRGGGYRFVNYSFYIPQTGLALPGRWDCQKQQLGLRRATT